MQTPLLFTPQTAQKPPTDVANKNESNISKVTSDSGKTPFQMTLDKQVRAKQENSQSNQAHVTSTQIKKVQNAQTSANKSVVGSQATQLKLDGSQIDKTSEVRPATAQDGKLVTAQDGKLDIAQDGKLDIAQDDKITITQDAQPALTISNLPLDEKEKMDVLPEDGTKSVIVLTEPISVLPTNKAALASANAHIAVSQFAKSSKDVALDKQGLNLEPDSIVPTAKSPDLMSKAVVDQQTKFGPVLDGTLSAVKNPLIAGSNDSDTHAQIDQVLDHTRWLSDVAGKGINENVNLSKAVLNAVKDVIGAKELTVTPSIQPQIAQVQSQLAVQQVAQPLASSNFINVYPGKTGWDQAISQKVMWMVGAGEQSASLTLNPPDLGPLKVVIHVHNDQADTTFISDNDEVRRALESGLSHLRDKMHESGVQLGQANVSSSSQSQQQFQQAAQNRALAQEQAKQSENLPVENILRSRQIIHTANGLVDTFA